jgi:flagellar assembly protein FliH
MSSLPLELMRNRSGFSRDPRFSAVLGAPTIAAVETDVEAEAYSRGFADGSAYERDAALAAERGRDERRAAIEVGLARIDEASAVELRERLRQTVLALCEEAVLPLAVDTTGLVARIDKAVAMLQRSQDERRVLLHPADLELVQARLPADLRVDPDSSVERGGIRIETADGGIEDGPSQWRRILAEAFREC